MNKVEVLEKLEPFTKCRIKEALNPSIVFGDNIIWIRPNRGTQLIPFGEGGTTQLLKHTGVTKELLSRLTPNTLAKVFTESLGQCALLVQDESVVDIGEPYQWKPVSPERVLTTIERAVPKVDFHRIMTLPHHTVRIETVGDKQEAVRVNDIVRFGAALKFSPFGMINTSVQTFALRLACTNGMVSFDVLRERKFNGNGGNGDSYWDWLMKTTREAYSSVPRLVSRSKILARQRIPANRRASTLAALLRGAGFPRRDSETIRALALENPPETAWDMMNLITYGTSHITDKPTVIVRAQNAAAEFAEHSEHREICPACHRVV